MRKIIAGFNANTVIIMLVSGLLCYMQSKVLDAVWRLPAMEQQLNSFQRDINLMREELKREEEERKAADQLNRQRIKWVEDYIAKPKQP